MDRQHNNGPGGNILEGQSPEGQSLEGQSLEGQGLEGQGLEENVFEGNVFVGVAHLELHLPEARSLKEKRSLTRSLVQRIRNRHQVLVTEVDHQSLHQRAGFAICGLSTDAVDLEARLQRVSRTVDETWSGHVLRWDVELIQV